MQIPTKTNKSKKLILITTAGTLLLAAALAAYAFKFGPFATPSNTSINLQPTTSEQKSTGNDIKQSSLNQNQDEKVSSGSDPSPAPQPVEGSDKKLVGMEITAANQSDTTFQLRTFIQTITSDGSCVLSMKSSQGATYTATAGVQALSSTTTCKGFDIPLAELTSGSWTITVNFSNDNLIASTSKEITIK